MTEETGAEYLIKKLREQYDASLGQMARGQTEQEYRRLVGVLQGLGYAIELIVQVQKDVENSDE